MSTEVAWRARVGLKSNEEHFFPNEKKHKDGRATAIAFGKMEVVDDMIHLWFRVKRLARKDSREKRRKCKIESIDSSKFADSSYTVWIYSIYLLV